MKEYIPLEEATTIPVLPKGQRVKFRSIDEAFEAGWKTCQEYIATCIEPADVEERKTAQWIPSGIPDSILDKCSECGFDTGANTFHYCPMCGAKMEKLIKVEELEQGADPGYPPFGSYGDSVTIDEVVKQSKTAPDVQDISSWPTANSTYGDNCWARLPCGICRNTMMQCPMHVQEYEVTCSSQTGTTGATVK